MTLPDDFIDPEHTGKDRELLRTFYETCHADGGTADEITLRGIRAVLALAAADRPAAVAPEAPRRPRYTRHYADGSWQGADHPGGPWRSIPAPQSGLPWRVHGPAVPESREPASVATQSTGQPRPLSPAAQAVLNAFRNVPDLRDCPSLAAAILALADQVVPAASSLDRATWSPFAGQIRSEILAIATELKGTNG